MQFIHPIVDIVLRNHDNKKTGRFNPCFYFIDLIKKVFFIVFVVFVFYRNVYDLQCYPITAVNRRILKITF